MDTETCGHCEADITNNFTPRCFTCGFDIGSPNVREVSQKEEVAALEERYKIAIGKSRTKEEYDNLMRFDTDMRKTCVVANMKLGDLHSFLTNPQSLYSTYAFQVRGEVRKPARPQDDRHRRTVDSMVFGIYGERIRFAVLSLDGSGVKSYGPLDVQLREIAISRRTTLLEENSYHFVETHNMRPGQKLPSGYRSTWQDRHKLAVAKIAEYITEDTSPEDHAGLLLFGEGNRATDSLIEVHIYGAFDEGAIEAVRGKSSPKSGADKAHLAVIKDYLKSAGKEWIEE